MEVARQVKTINLVLKIGDISLSRKAVKSLELERNYSDVSDKFSIVLIDSPSVNTTDLELYMNAGYRDITFSYSDTADKTSFVKFVGTIWDYSPVFVGNIKQLTITGYVTRTNQSSVGKATYNIDWNTYYNLRIDATKPWNVYKQVSFAEGKLYEWQLGSANKEASERPLYNSNVIYQTFRNYYTYNSVTVKIKGPKGTIYLPVPDSFYELDLGAKEVEQEDGTKIQVESMLKDPKNLFWGELEFQGLKYEYTSSGNDMHTRETAIDNTAGLYLVKGTDQIRGFKSKATDTNPSKSFVQMNSMKEYYGAGSFVYSDVGVDPSYIVKQLAILEGWEVAKGGIVQTDLVPCSDKFKMNDQSALQFITEVLAPVSMTPIGNYTTKTGGKQTLSSGYGGFTAYFDSNNKFHYEPIDLVKNKVLTDIKLGYNFPDSPVISFQVETKGTSFYTTQPIALNSMTMATGQPVQEVVTLEKAQTIDYNKVTSHNEHLDQFFGYTYEEINNKLNYYTNNHQCSPGYWLGHDGTKDQVYFSTDDRSVAIKASLEDIYQSKVSTTSDDYKAIISSNAINSKLVTLYTKSATTGSAETRANLEAARKKIRDFMITASMSLWGNTKIIPSSIIRVTNMVRSEDKSVTVHPSSGEYIVLKQTDSISGDNFIQKLSLLRYKSDLNSTINPKNIDWSIAPTEDTKYMNYSTPTPASKTTVESKPGASSPYMDEYNKPTATGDYLNSWSAPYNDLPTIPKESTNTSSSTSSSSSTSGDACYYPGTTYVDGKASLTPSTSNYGKLP